MRYALFLSQFCGWDNWGTDKSFAQGHIAVKSLNLNYGSLFSEAKLRSTIVYCFPGCACGSKCTFLLLLYKVWVAGWAWASMWRPFVSPGEQATTDIVVALGPESSLPILE